VADLEKRLLEIFRGYLVRFPDVFEDDCIVTAEVYVKSVIDAQLKSLMELFDGFSVEPNDGFLRIYTWKFKKGGEW